MTAAAEKVATVLFIDDDPQHLKLYQWVIQRGPFTVVPLLVGGSGHPAFPTETPDIVALDYRLKGSLTSVEIAQELKAKYPKTPIVVLSEMEWLPDDVAPYSAAFVRKGNPDKLLQTLSDFTNSGG
jgi:DNA-binding response OmpR family regulator